jgi:tight adherence protein B
MTVLFAALLGPALVLSGFAAVMVWRPPEMSNQRRGRRLADLLPMGWSDRLLLRVGLGVGAMVVVAVATGWPAAALLAGMGGASAPSMIGGRARRHSSVARLEAIAAWTEQVRGVINSANGIREAILATGPTAPPAIHDEVARLVDRLTVRRERLPVALAGFADDLAHPVGDKVVASLVLASQLRGSPVELLGQLSASVRRAASIRLDIEASRASTYVTTRLILVLTVIMTIWLVVMQRPYMQAYSSPVGQVVLLAIGAMYAVAGQRMTAMAEPWQQARLLTAIDDREGEL